MNDSKRQSRTDASNPLDEFLNADQEGKISRPESVPGVGFDDKADDIAHRPRRTSREHSLDDVQERQEPSCLDEDFLGEAAENAAKKEESSFKKR
jgi:hypothetical protein